MKSAIAGRLVRASARRGLLLDAADGCCGRGSGSLSHRSSRLKRSLDRVGYYHFHPWRTAAGDTLSMLDRASGWSLPVPVLAASTRVDRLRRSALLTSVPPCHRQTGRHGGRVRADRWLLSRRRICNPSSRSTTACSLTCSSVHGRSRDAMTAFGAVQACFAGQWAIVFPV